ncbi:MAG: NAD-dependent epimerase/dehydratase family protein, partial [Hymenobacter sp.]
NIDIARDWGWAPDYVEAMWLMLQQDKPDDFVIATGHTTKLKDFIRAVFDCLTLNWEDYVESDLTFYRPTDIAEGHANPDKAKRVLGWEATYKMEDVAKLMVEHQLSKSQKTTLIEL